jgi:3-ketosteroid 9alpha-monooxygenase subunit A
VPAPPLQHLHGWYSLAFERDLASALTPLPFGERQLLAVRSDGRMRVVDARCPHRGAHLGHGGRVAGGNIVCPFHSYRVGIGCVSADGFLAREYPSLLHGGMLFVRLSAKDDVRLAEALSAFDEGHTFVPGFELTAHTTIEMVMENGFDAAHFRSVHRLLNIPSLEVGTGRWNELQATGRFEIPRSGWHDSGGSGTKLGAAYVAHAFSPGVVITELQGDPPFNYRIMTTATPAPDERSSTVRLTLILPDGPDGTPPNEQFANDLLAASRSGMEQDCAIWDHIDLSAPQFKPEDRAAVAFAEFCRPFRES